MNIVLPALGALAITGMLMPSQKVAAANDTKKNVDVYTLSSSDPYVSDTLKTKVICKLANRLGNIDYSQIDMEDSKVIVSGLNYNRTGIQAVTLNTKIVMRTNPTKAADYSSSDNAVINITDASSAVLKLKKASVVVNNGDTWNPSSYIAAVSDRSGMLPVLKEVDNVDMNTDGDYYASYIAVDSQGNSTSAILNVKVKTPQEVLDAQAASSQQAQAEAAQKAEQEAAAERAKNVTPLDLSKLGNYAGGINTALSMAGNVPYVYGGTSPETGFDCSGFVSYSLGLSARTTYEQQALGTHRYDVENAPAGALYFYGSDAAPYHVALSLGNGTAVQALNPSQGIQVVANGSFMPSYYVVIGQ